VRKAGAGRGIPDFKENPRAGRVPAGTAASQAAPLEAAQAEVDANGARGGQPPAQKFNAQEAAEWMAQRYQAVIEEYEKQKQSGKKGDIQSFSDLNSERSAWAGSKPVIPPKEDFLFQLSVALNPYRTKQPEEQKGPGGSS